jgi:hypothetical protein
VALHLRYNVEVSFNIKTEVFIVFSLDWFSWVFIGVDDVPLLVETVVSVPSNDVSVLVIFTSCDIEDLSFFVNNMGTLVSPELPPS